MPGNTLVGKMMTYTAKASIDLTIDANVAWRYLSDCRNFAKFLSNVREVKEIGTDLWEWRLQGVLGIPLFGTTISALNEQSRRIIWDSLEGSFASHGWIQLESSSSGSVITMSLQYRLPLGVINDVFAGMFQDPQGILEQDLQKLRYLLTQNSPSSKSSTRHKNA